MEKPKTRIYDGCTSDPTGVMLAEVIETRRAEIRHARAMTPLASKPLASGKRRARRPGTRRSRQVMRVRVKRSVY